LAVEGRASVTRARQGPRDPAIGGVDGDQPLADRGPDLLAIVGDAMDGLHTIVGTELAHDLGGACRWGRAGCLAHAGGS
jgi:hypothetical protein